MKQILSLLILALFCLNSISSEAQIRNKKKDKDAKEAIEDVQEELEDMDLEGDDPEKEPYTEENSVNTEAKIEVEEVMTSFGLGESAGLKVNIVGASKKALQKDWSKYLKKATDVKKVEESRSGEMVADMALIPGLESLPMSVFSIVKETSNGAEIHSSYKLDEIFLSAENEDKWNIIKKFIYEYAVDYRKGLVERELQDAQKDLKKEQSNLKKLKDNNADLYKSIKDYEEKIAQAKEDIITNENDQKSSNLMIDKLMRAVTAVEKRLSSIR